MNCRAVVLACIVVFASSSLPGSAQDAGRNELPLVWVLATGGTISGKGASSTSLTEYKSGSLLGEELVRGVPEIRAVARVQVEQIANVSSTDITVANWLTIARRINEIFATDPKVAGVVVTHGTNTLEETAYFLNLTVKDDRPVVMVGSMRPASAISADGPLNLLNAVRTAVSQQARGKGVLVVLNDEINSARDVTKTNTLRVETFRAPELGLLGYVDGDQVSFYRSSTRRHTRASEFDVSGLTELPQTEIVYSYVQPSLRVVDALVASGARGIVFRRNRRRVVIDCRTGRVAAVVDDAGDDETGAGQVEWYGNGRVAGREDYDALGMIAADTLNPQKARVLLMLALSKTHDLKEIARMFREY